MVRIIVCVVIGTSRFFQVCGLITPKSPKEPTSTSRETLLSSARRFAARSWSLAFRASDCTVVFSDRRSAFGRWSLSSLAATCSAVSSDRRFAILSWFRARPVSAWTGVSWERWAARFLAATAPLFLRNGGQPYAYTVRVSPNWCPPAYAASSLLPLVTRMVNCSRSPEKRRKSPRPSFKGHLRSTHSVSGFITSSIGNRSHSHVHFRLYGGPRASRFRSAALGNACDR